MTQPHGYTRDECLDAIRKVAEDLGHPPTKLKYEETNEGPSERTIRKVLGVNFDRAREMAGLDVPLEGDERKVNLDVGYFEDISAPDQTYWLGTLWGQSAQKERDGVRSVVISHKLTERHFVEGIHDAIGAGYEIYRFNPDDHEERIQFAITNQEFVKNLRDLGLVDSGRNVGSLPDVPADLQPHFVRGFLEVRSRLSSDGIELRSHHRSKLETLADWIENFGVERTHVGELQDGRYSFRVGSMMDVAPLFETCWVGIEDTSIRSDTFYREGKRTVCDKYPYPSNLSFCGSESKDSNNEVDTEPRSDRARDELAQPQNGEGSETSPVTHEDRGLTISLPPSLILACQHDVASSDGSVDPSVIVNRRIVKYTRELVGASYPGESGWPELPVRGELLNVPVELPAPTRVAVEAFVDDPDSPFDSIGEYATAALCYALGDSDPSTVEHQLTVDGETAALLRAVGDGDATEGAMAVLEEAIRQELNGG